MSKLGDILHELAETVGRGHLHEVIDSLEKDEDGTPETPAPASGVSTPLFKAPGDDEKDEETDAAQ